MNNTHVRVKAFYSLEAQMLDIPKRVTHLNRKWLLLGGMISINAQVLSPDAFWITGSPIVAISNFM